MGCNGRILITSYTIQNRESFLEGYLSTSHIIPKSNHWPISQNKTPHLPYALPNPHSVRPRGVKEHEWSLYLVIGGLSLLLMIAYVLGEKRRALFLFSPPFPLFSFSVFSQWFSLSMFLCFFFCFLSLYTTPPTQAQLFSTLPNLLSFPSSFFLQVCHRLLWFCYFYSCGCNWVPSFLHQVYHRHLGGSIAVGATGFVALIESVAARAGVAWPLILGYRCW